MRRAQAGALFETGAIIGERHVLVSIGALGDATAQGAGVTLSHGMKKPARLPAVAAMRQLRRIGQIGFERGDLIVVVARANFDPGGFQPREAIIQRLFSLGRGGRPSRGLEHRKPLWLYRRRHRIGTLQTGRAGIAADPRDDLASDLPCVLQRRSENAGAALALIIVTALTVDRVDARLKADAAAEARRADD
jgi:hypothetical protein